MTTAPVSLLDALRQYRLLEPAQLEEVVRDLQARFPEPKALARELLQRGWLTAYQANQLLQGKGQELLLGSYVLLERLGAGGMGQVFKARNWKLGRVVALKMIRKDRLANADAVRRFQREVRSVAALSHPNIVLAYDADQIAGTHLLVMEYIAGAVDLAQFLKTNGPLAVPQACEYIRQAALGLQHAYERGLVHRDIKPANLLLCAAGTTIKILDMGLARLDSPAAGDESSTMTREDAVMGTPDYIAPEQALESHTVDIRADLYSLGCTFYYLLTRRVPFPGGSLIQKIDKHRHEEPKALELLRPELPSGVVRVVHKLMAKKPEARYQTPAEVVTALAAAHQGNELVEEGEGTVAEGGRVGAVSATSGETLASPFASLAPRSPAEAAAPPRSREAKERLWLLGGLAGPFVLIGMVGVALLVWRLFAGPKQPVEKQGSAVVDRAPAKKTAASSEEEWLEKVAALPPDKQVEAVAHGLKQRNPTFDGKLTPTTVDGVVTELKFSAKNVSDLAPLRALVGLQILRCQGPGTLSDLRPLKDLKLTALYCSRTQVSDLRPLKDMKLTQLDCNYTPVTDLCPLKDMKLTELRCSNTKVTDLTPLKDMKLTELRCSSTKVTDLTPLKDMKLTKLDCSITNVTALSPLRDMKLTELYCSDTQVTDLTPLEEMKLAVLDLGNTPVADLTPLKDMQLKTLYCNGTKVIDLTPLQGMPLQRLKCDFKPERDAAILRTIKTLETINDKPAADVLK